MRRPGFYELKTDIFMVVGKNISETTNILIEGVVYKSVAG